MKLVLIWLTPTIFPPSYTSATTTIDQNSNTTIEGRNTQKYNGLSHEYQTLGKMKYGIGI